jgi:hypothetical protein
MTARATIRFRKFADFAVPSSIDPVARRGDVIVFRTPRTVVRLE